MSRLASIMTAVETHVSSAFSGVTIFNDVLAFDELSESEFPAAIVLFAEEAPERLPFKQERRRVVGSVSVGVRIAAGATIEATREIVDAGFEAIRDAIFADDDLSGTVDYVTVERAETFSGREDPIVYGSLEITTEEVF